MYILIIIRPKGRCARNRGGCVVLLSSSRGPLQRRAYVYRVTGAVKRQHVLYTTHKKDSLCEFKGGGFDLGVVEARGLPFFNHDEINKSVRHDP